MTIAVRLGTLADPSSDDRATVDAQESARGPIASSKRHSSATRTGGPGMVKSSFDAATGVGRIVLQPNRSWSWRDNRLFLASLLLLSVLIAIGFALIGLWLVMPFSLLEVAVVAFAFWYCVRRTHRQEVITFDFDQVRIEAGIDAPVEVHEFQRAFARFHLVRAAHRWHAPAIVLRSHGREVAIGSFLGDDDRDQLLRDLRTMVARFAGPSIAGPGHGLPDRLVRAAL